jgi:glycosyltransferase involved in cell wall biosynthesis
LKLIFLGTGPLLKKMQRFVFRQGLEKNIDFLGYRSECINYIANSSFLLNPSLELESLPYSILEAMSVGVPAIGTNVGGIPEEIEDGVTGIIVAAGDTEKLVQAMLTLIKDSRKRQEMGEASRRRFADSFTLDKMLDNYLQLYAGLN